MSKVVCSNFILADDSDLLYSSALPMHSSNVSVWAKQFTVDSWQLTRNKSGRIFFIITILSYFKEHSVQYWNKYQGDECAHEQTTHDGDSQGAKHGVWHQRYHAEDSGETRHHHRTQT